jgi:hypothetical protein
MNNKRIIIGLALSYKLNPIMFRRVSLLIFIFKIFFKYEVIILSPNNLDFSSIGCTNYRFEDDDSLFDFSRYHRIVNSPILRENDVLFMFNDTLGNGRKFNFGLILFVIISIFLLTQNILVKIHLCAPVDSDSQSRWVCPYFMIGRTSFLRSLNFTNWKVSQALLNKSIRYKLVDWLNRGWRRADYATASQKKIKYKTLLLERTLLSDFAISNNVLKFSRSNPFRILNSFSI